CPDGGTCEDRNTCCKNPAGGYSCCPLPHAECCSDHLHCCYQGTVCDLERYRCVNNQVRSGLTAVICPDSRYQCPDGATCCQLPDGSWGCCLLSSAVCCADKIHCCPEGSKCDLTHSRCVSPSQQLLPMMQKVPASRRAAAPVICPDGKSSCSEGATCCQLTSGEYGCCPYPQAVCCSDHMHCCPAGMHCDLEHNMCMSGNMRVPLLEKMAAVHNEDDTKCDDTASCPGDYTCCRTLKGGWACCPLAQAVCCSDHLHCCPRGYRCNLAAQTCDKAGGASLPWLLKVPALVEPSPALPAQLAEVVCDNQTSCPSHTTCCFVQKWQKFGCCPVPNAVCCEGGSHCCPMGHRCDPYRSSCSKGPLVTPWFTKLSAVTQPGAPTDIKCDDSSRCPAGTTCCKLQSGGWGCCPLVKAVCCEDHEHCCPQGYSCRMETGTCEKKNHGAPVFSVPQRRLLPSGAGRPEGLAPCGGTGEFHCPKEDTCCPTSATEWACCPSPGAVCCSDHKHCCPAGFSCDLKAGGCVRDPSPWDAWFHRPVRSRL
uniref:Granulin b n=1 Tax=Tetraodon nigroviridis TaxID=99883 RepID=H3D2S2_TETNG